MSDYARNTSTQGEAFGQTIPDVDSEFNALQAERDVALASVEMWAARYDALREERDRETELRRKAEHWAEGLRDQLAALPYTDEWPAVEAELTALREELEGNGMENKGLRRCYAESRELAGSWKHEHDKLRAENERLREALERLAEKWERHAAEDEARGWLGEELRIVEATAWTDREHARELRTALSNDTQEGPTVKKLGDDQ